MLSCVVPLDKSWSKTPSGRKAADNHIPCKDNKIGAANPLQPTRCYLAYSRNILPRAG